MLFLLLVAFSLFFVVRTSAGAMGGKDKNKKPKDDDDGSYSYCTEEEDPQPHLAEPAAEPPARPRVTATASKAKAAPKEEDKESDARASPGRRADASPSEDGPRTWRPGPGVTAERPSSPPRTRGKSEVPAVPAPPPVPRASRRDRDRDRETHDVDGGVFPRGMRSARRGSLRGREGAWQR